MNILAVDGMSVPVKANVRLDKGFPRQGIKPRELLYRGKTEKGKWVYGSLPNEFDRYTGLNDKNGVKIFEGDIVKSDNEYVGDIQFSYGVFGVEWIRCKQNRYMKDRHETLHNLRRFDDGFNAKIEVIGNIHDNPELLEEGK